MQKENKRKKYKEENGEDVTKYGEFVSSYFSWTTLEKQKKTAEKLENITKTEENQSNKKNK